MLRTEMARRLVSARWLQFGEELAGDHGLGKWFLPWFGEMYTMAALTCVNRNTRKARILQCDRCKEVWDFKNSNVSNTWPGAADAPEKNRFLTTSMSRLKSLSGERLAEGATCTCTKIPSYMGSSSVPWPDKASHRRFR